VDLYIGATVETSDGQEAGVVERVVVDLDTNEVTHYVVHTELGRRRDVLIPAALADERIRILSLRLSPQELENLPDYQEVRYGLPPHGFSGRPASGSNVPAPGMGVGLPTQWDRNVELTQGEPVECEDGPVGALKGVVVDEITDEVTDLVVELTQLRKSATIPTAWASKLGPGRIHLQCQKQEVEAVAR